MVRLLVPLTVAILFKIYAGEILYAHVNAPGSWHDSRVAKGLYYKLFNDTPDGFYLVSDTAFPRGAHNIDGKIKAPAKANARRVGTPEELAAAAEFDRQLLSYRQTAEWGMRLIQGSFGRLRVPLSIKYSESRSALLEVCVRLTNLRTRTVGHNEIRTVYTKIWRGEGAEDERLWRNFEDVLFSDQRRLDRVSRFHNAGVYE